MIPAVVIYLSISECMRYFTSPCCLGSAALRPSKGLAGQITCLDALPETKLLGEKSWFRQVEMSGQVES